MSSLRRIALVRHGETDGQSSIRLHGTGDVGLTAEGRGQMDRVARRLGSEPFDRVLSSPMRRAWQSAWIAGRGQPVELVHDFREVDFGRWEGLTVEEIQRSEPVLYEEWRGGEASFAYPGGESRAAFRARVEHGLEALLASGAHTLLVVAHKGVIRVIVEKLVGEPLAPEDPPVGGLVNVTRQVDGSWFCGRNSSDPPALRQSA